MNDILSRFLIVLESEDQAYSCFVNYMENVKSDFLEDGMLAKISKYFMTDLSCALAKNGVFAVHRILMFCRKGAVGSFEHSSRFLTY